MIVYRASELGSCTRRLMLGRVGYDAMEPPEKYKGYFARGDEAEVLAKEIMRDDGWLIDREQEEVVLDITDEIKVVGHIDGVGNHVGDWLTKPNRLLEVKRMNNTYWTTVRNGGWYVDGLMAKYRWQISAYMLATGLEVVLACYNGDTGEMHYLYAEEPFYSKADIAARVLVVEGRARSFTTLDAAGECDSLDYPCPFYYTHDEKEMDDIEPEVAELVEAAGVAYRDAKERERRAKEDAQQCRDEIVRMLGGAQRVHAGRVRVTSYSSSRKYFDRKRAEADGLDLRKYDSKRTSTTVRITVGEEEDANEG